MARQQRLLIASIIVIIMVIVLVAVLYPLLGPGKEVRGKSPASPLQDTVTEEQALAQDLALSDAAVQNLTVGKRSEVFGVRSVGNHYTPQSSACADFRCYQVEIYNFDENAAVVAIVDIENRQVLDVLHEPGIHPGINKRLADLALEIAIHSPEVVNELGFQPEQADMAPVNADLLGSSCDKGHLCVAPTFNLSDRILWAVVDLTDDTIAGIAYTSSSTEPTESIPFHPEGCPSPGTWSQDGWSMSYEVTGTDGLRVYDVTYNGVPVLTSVKLVEWHADYGNVGYRDETGCGGGGGGFPIEPYRETQINDIPPIQNGPGGFEIVQDFRMSNWGENCNYRYEQHIQFFVDGSFRVVSGAFGRGCTQYGSPSTYRPVVRIDIAVAGDSNDSFYRWDGSDWALMGTEDYLVPYPETGHGPHQYDPQGYSWLVEDLSGTAYKIRLMSEGPPDDGYHDDDPFLYPVLHHSNEGDADLGVIGSCCNDNQVQGPDIYLNGENINRQNIVLWYVAQMETSDTPGDYYCWTVSGEPDPETYPCWSGPLFVPYMTSAVNASFNHSGPATVGETVIFTNTSSGPQPLSYLWDFGDGSPTSTLENPTHVFNSEGDWPVSLTVSNPQDSDVYTDTVNIGLAAVSSFSHNSPIGVGETAIFTNTSSGTPPLFFVWNFGDGSTISSEQNPTHIYSSDGIYTVTLTTSNVYNSSLSSSGFAVEVPPLAKFTYVHEAHDGIPVQFVNQTIGGKTYSWDFGDGTPASTLPNPTHLYSAIGTYQVTLEVKNQFGMDTYTLPVVVLLPTFLPDAIKN